MVMVVMVVMNDDDPVAVTRLRRDDRRDRGQGDDQAEQHGLPFVRCH